MVYTVSKLQREFGLPFATAEAIIREQMALARQHYRRWYVPACIAIVVGMAGAFVFSSPSGHTVFGLMWPVAMLCVGTTELLAQRRAEAPILAAARAAGTTVAPAR